VDNVVDGVIRHQEIRDGVEGILSWPHDPSATAEEQGTHVMQAMALARLAARGIYIGDYGLSAPLVRDE